MGGSPGVAWNGQMPAKGPLPAEMMAQPQPMQPWSGAAPFAWQQNFRQIGPGQWQGGGGTPTSAPPGVQWQSQGVQPAASSWRNAMMTGVNPQQASTPMGKGSGGGGGGKGQGGGAMASAPWSSGTLPGMLNAGTLPGMQQQTAAQQTAAQQPAAPAAPQQTQEQQATAAQQAAQQQAAAAAWALKGQTPPPMPAPAAPLPKDPMADYWASFNYGGSSV